MRNARSSQIVDEVGCRSSSCVRRKAGIMCCASNKRSSASHGDIAPGKAGEQPATWFHTKVRTWYGRVRLWQEHALDIQLSAVWQTGHEEAWLLISDRPAGRERVREYRWRMRVESTFQDMKSRGWQWEQSHVRKPDHLNRMLLVLFLAFWWLMRLAASCIHNGRRERYDRHDRRDKGFLRLGRLYLLDMARSTRSCFLWNCLLFHRTTNGWAFSLRF
jgi:hypothetical protein